MSVARTPVLGSAAFPKPHPQTPDPKTGGRATGRRRWSDCLRHPSERGRADLLFSSAVRLKNQGSAAAEVKA